MLVDDVVDEDEHDADEEDEIQVVIVVDGKVDDVNDDPMIAVVGTVDFVEQLPPFVIVVVAVDVGLWPHT